MRAFDSSFGATIRLAAVNTPVLTVRAGRARRLRRALFRQCDASTTTPSYLNFDKVAYPWKSGIDYRAKPKRYRVGKGEQGVLICEPYKSEIAPHWRFRTQAIAKRSAREIYKMFLAYLDDDDFVGADLARKFLQMGYTRARRYANYKGGRKYDKDYDYKLRERGTGDPEKAESAAIFSEYWKKAENEKRYAAQKKAWKSSVG